MGTTFGYCDNENRKSATKMDETFYEKMANGQKDTDKGDVINSLGLKPSLKNFP